VGEGRVDLGITGRDQVAEHEAKYPATEERSVEEVLNLGFGKCKLQVQVPEKGGPNDPRDLIGKNVVTSFTGLTEQYFKRLESEMANGDAPGAGTMRTNIIELSGSVEAACALGIGHGVVDLVGELTSQCFNLETTLMDVSRIWSDHGGRGTQSYRYCFRKYCCTDQINTAFESTAH